MKFKWSDPTTYTPWPKLLARGALRLSYSPFYLYQLPKRLAAWLLRDELIAHARALEILQHHAAAAACRECYGALMDSAEPAILARLKTVERRHVDAISAKEVPPCPSS